MKTLKLTGAAVAREADVQAALIARLQVAGWLVVRVNGGAMKTRTGFYRAYTVAGMAHGSSGFPDVLALKGDDAGVMRARLFEVKARDGALSDSQRRFATFAGAFNVEVEIVQDMSGLDALTL